MRRLLKIISLIAGLVLLLILLFPGYLYWDGLRALPEETSPTLIRYSPYTEQAVLASLTGDSHVTMTPLNPWSVLLTIGNRDRQTAKANSYRIASVTARLLMARSQKLPVKSLNRNLAYTAAAIWVSRHWSTEQAISTYLATAYYGHGFYGFEEAARGYYGVPPDKLSNNAILVLVALLKAPKLYDPWCAPQRSEQAVKYLDERAHLTSADALQQSVHEGLLPAPAHACPSR